MQAQFRFSVFGDVPMLLTPVLAVRFLCESRPELRRIALAACCALFAVAFYPTIANWQARYTPGRQRGICHTCAPHSRYSSSHARSALASYWAISTPVTGLRYHSQCSVIADVFLLTPQHAAKVIESARLLAKSPAELLTAKPEVRYVFAHHSVTLTYDEKGVEIPDLDKLRLQMHHVERRPARSRGEHSAAIQKALGSPDSRGSASTRGCTKSNAHSETRVRQFHPLPSGRMDSARAA